MSEKQSRPEVVKQVRGGGFNITRLQREANTKNAQRRRSEREGIVAMVGRPLLLPQSEQSELASILKQPGVNAK